MVDCEGSVVSEGLDAVGGTGGLPMDSQQDARKGRGTTRVVPFQPRSAGPSREDDGRRGEVLLFTGVRYERHGEAGQPASAPQPTAGGLGGPRRRA